MNGSLIEKLKTLKISDYVFVIFIVISLAGIFANKEERDDYLHKDPKGREKAHKIRLTILTISLLIYIYFLQTKVKNRESATNKFLNNLDILAAILFVIAGAIFLYNEFKGDDNPIIIE